MSGEHRIWVDASYRAGITALAVVHDKHGLLKAEFGETEIQSSHEAEMAAVKLGKELAVEHDYLPAVITTDSTPVAYRFRNNKLGLRVEWRPRRENKAHDAALNLLRTRISHPEPSSVPSFPKRERAKPVKEKPKRPLPYLPVPESGRKDWKAQLQQFWDRLGDSA